MLYLEPDAKVLMDEYDVCNDEVAFPIAYDHIEMESDSYSQTPYESSYVNNNLDGIIVGYDDCEDYDDSFHMSYNDTMQRQNGPIRSMFVE